ncbi:MAG TPA: response regulator [Haliangiales bacterium]|nr:response regulator [Haliangiales bacterium]
MNTRECVIMLAEDDPNDVLLFQRAFQKLNLANPIQVVRDGEEAVAYLSGQGEYGDRERHPMPVLLLLDLKMPRRSGFEVLQWLRQQSGLKRLPVVVLTSSNQHPDINRAFDLGANSYLVKPGGFDSLLELVKGLDMYWLILNEKPELRGG